MLQALSNNIPWGASHMFCIAVCVFDGKHRAWCFYNQHGGVKDGEVVRHWSCCSALRLCLSRNDEHIQIQQQWWHDQCFGCDSEKQGDLNPLLSDTKVLLISNDATPRLVIFFYVLLLLVLPCMCILNLCTNSFGIHTLPFAFTLYLKA